MADASARFELDIAAKSDGLENTADAAERLRSEIEGDERKIKDLERALKNMQGGASVSIEKFKGMTAALKAKKEAVAEASAKLIDLGGTFAKPAKAAGGLADAFKKQEDPLAAIRKEQEANLKRHEQDAAAKVALEKKQMDEIKKLQEANLKRHDQDAKARAELEKKKADDTKKAALEASKSQSDLASAVEGAGGPVGELTAKFRGLSDILGKGGVAGAAAIAVAAVLLVVGALVAATVALAAFALQVADAARSAGILREAATGSAAGAARLEKEIAAVAGRVPTAKGAIEELANSLARLGLEGNALETALSAIATTSAVMGSAAGSALQGIIERSKQGKRFLLNMMDLKGTGIKIQEVAGALAKRLGITTQTALAAIQNGQVKLADGIAALDDVVMAKFGPLAARQMLALPTQIAKAKEALQAMFSGVKIEGFLKALQGVLGLLGENTISGKALKAVFESLLNPLFAGIETYGPLAKAFFQGMIIGALYFAIVVAKLRKSFSETFGGARSSILSVENALLLGKGAVGAIVGGLALLTIVLGALAVAVTLVALPFVLMGAAIAAVIYGAYQAGSAVVGLFQNLPAVLDAVVSKISSAGQNLVGGFVTALLSGAGLVYQAAASLAMSALNAIKKTLGIASDSKETKKLGGFTTSGFAHQVEANAPEVQESMAAAFAAPPAGDAASGGAAAGRATAKASEGKAEAGISVSISGDVYIGGRKQDSKAEAESWFADVLRGARQRAALGGT